MIEKIRRKFKKKTSIAETIRENIGWAATVTTILGIIIAKIVTFIELLKANRTFSFYGLDTSFYENNSTAFLYELCNGILILLVLTLTF